MTNCPVWQTNQFASSPEPFQRAQPTAVETWHNSESFQRVTGYTPKEDSNNGLGRVFSLEQGTQIIIHSRTYGEKVLNKLAQN